MSFLVVIGVLVLFFLAIWGLTYAFHRTRVPIASWLMWGTSAMVIGASLFWLIVEVIYWRQGKALGFRLRRTSNLLAELSFLWGLAAFFVQVIKRLFRRVRTNKVDDYDLARRILLLVKDHHGLFGWVTLIAAAAHGFYFLLYPTRHWSEFYTGVAAWLALAVLAITGHWIKRAAPAPQRVKNLRSTHLALAIGYASAIILHYPAGLLLAGVLIGAALAAMGLMGVFMRLVADLRRS